MTRSVKLGSGVVVPYPEPTSPEATAIGKANRRTDTKCEVEVRRALHAMGLRFRKDLLIRAGSSRTKADIVFSRARAAVFIDGCFWHVCPQHFQMPKSNRAYWEPKLLMNVERDKRATSALEATGWNVLRIWEHVAPAQAAKAVVTRLADLGHPTARRLVVTGGP